MEELVYLTYETGRMRTMWSVHRQNCW